MTPFVPSIDTSDSEKKGIFNKWLFLYDAEKDRHICPTRQELIPRGTVTDIIESLKTLVMTNPNLFLA